MKNKYNFSGFPKAPRKETVDIGKDVIAHLKQHGNIGLGDVAAIVENHMDKMIKNKYRKREIIIKPVKPYSFGFSEKDTSKYEVYPDYVDHKGAWFSKSGKTIFARMDDADIDKFVKRNGFYYCVGLPNQRWEIK